MSQVTTQKAIITNVRVHTVAEQASRNRAILEDARLEKAKLIRKYGRKAYEAFEAVVNNDDCGKMDDLVTTLGVKKTDKIFDAFSLNNTKLNSANERMNRKLSERNRTTFVTESDVFATVSSIASDKEGDTIKVDLHTRDDGSVVAVRK